MCVKVAFKEVPLKLITILKSENSFYLHSIKTPCSKLTRVKIYPDQGPVELDRFMGLDEPETGSE